MRQLKRIPEMQQTLDHMRRSGKKIGLVPTMGALHQGHISLVEAARKENDFLVVSIFVNPTQFNDPKDLERYPRDEAGDLKMLEEAHTDLVFSPDVKEMYPEPDRRSFDLHPLDSVMEGKYRPGHFAGVAEIVSKLFEIVMPDTAYFGLKDFQQLAVIRKLTSVMDVPVRIVGCPIIREKDGLAMSSRNQLLAPEDRKAAPYIYQTLLEAKELRHSLSPAELTAWVEEKIRAHPLMQLEYFEIVDDKELITANSWEGAANKVGCIAVHLGEVRLIDNIYFA